MAKNISTYVANFKFLYLTTRITIVSIHVIWVIEYRLLVGVDRMVVGC